MQDLFIVQKAVEIEPVITDFLYNELKEPCLFDLKLISFNNNYLFFGGSSGHHKLARCNLVVLLIEY